VVQWFTLTREFVEYTLTSTFARNVLMAMARVEIPDESFFQVLLMNSPFNNTVGLSVRYSTTHPVLSSRRSAEIIAKEWRKHSPLIVVRPLPQPPAPTSQICRFITWDKCNYEVRLEPTATVRVRFIFRWC
jgi:hypothetical protein